MARNTEIKARIESIAALAPRAAAIATDGPRDIVQDDTFFVCDRGRLKLRAFPSGDGELIFYVRADRHGPKESFYLISRTADASALREVLTHAYGQGGRVRKRRTLYLVGRTRIHLDDVEGLGAYLELEVVLEDGDTSAAGVAEAHNVMRALGVEASQLVEGAYVDLLAGQER